MAAPAAQRTAGIRHRHAADGTVFRGPQRRPALPLSRATERRFHCWPGGGDRL